MPQLTLSASMNYTAPGGATVNQEFVAIGSYAASSLGVIDVPSGAAQGATFSAPLGAVAAPVGFGIKNSVGTAVRLKFQGNPTGMWLPNNGCVLMGGDKIAASSPLSAIQIDLISAQTAPGELSYIIFGD
jgi:hypothetical protein